MLYCELTDYLQNLIKQKITQQDIGEALNITKQAIGNKKADGYNFQPFEVEKIKDYIIKKYGVQKLSEIDGVKTVELDYYPDLDFSCGNGLIPFGHTKEKKKVPINFINGYSEHKRYVIVNAKSDSMMPEIKPNDLLIIRVIDNEPIIDNHIYVFTHDEHLYCKYLSYNIGQVIARSANKDYPIRYIEKENLSSFHLHGEVCGHFRNYLSV